MELAGSEKPSPWRCRLFMECSNGGKEIGDNSKLSRPAYARNSTFRKKRACSTPTSLPIGERNSTHRVRCTWARCCVSFFIFGVIYYKGWVKWGLLSVVILGVLLAWGKNFSSLNYFLFDHFPFYNKPRAPALALGDATVSVSDPGGPGTGCIAGRKRASRGGLEEIQDDRLYDRRFARAACGFLFYGKLSGGPGCRTERAFCTKVKMQQLSQSRQYGTGCATTGAGDRQCA